MFDWPLFYAEFDCFDFGQIYNVNKFTIRSADWKRNRNKRGLPISCESTVRNRNKGNASIIPTIQISISLTMCGTRAGLACSGCISWSIDWWRSSAMAVMLSVETKIEVPSRANTSLHIATPWTNKKYFISYMHDTIDSNFDSIFQFIVWCMSLLRITELHTHSGI